MNFQQSQMLNNGWSFAADPDNRGRNENYMLHCPEDAIENLTLPALIADVKPIHTTVWADLRADAAAATLQ